MGTTGTFPWLVSIVPSCYAHTIFLVKTPFRCFLQTLFPLTRLIVSTKITLSTGCFNTAYKTPLITVEGLVNESDIWKILRGNNIDVCYRIRVNLLNLSIFSRFFIPTTYPGKLIKTGIHLQQYYLLVRPHFACILEDKARDIAYHPCPFRFQCTQVPHCILDYLFHIHNVAHYFCSTVDKWSDSGTSFH